MRRPCLKAILDSAGSKRRPASRRIDVLPNPANAGRPAGAVPRLRHPAGRRPSPVPLPDLPSGCASGRRRHRVPRLNGGRPATPGQPAAIVAARTQGTALLDVLRSHYRAFDQAARQPADGVGPGTRHGIGRRDSDIRPYLVAAQICAVISALQSKFFGRLAASESYEQAAARLAAASWPAPGRAKAGTDAVTATEVTCPRTS